MIVFALAKYLAGNIMIGLCSLLLAYNFYFVLKDQVAGWIAACKFFKKVINYLRNRKIFKNKILKDIIRDNSQSPETRGARMNKINNNISRRTIPILWKQTFFVDIGSVHD